MGVKTPEHVTLIEVAAMSSYYSLAIILFI